VLFLLAGGKARYCQEGVSQKAEGGIAVPGIPPPYLVLVQADLALGLREALFNGPPRVADSHELGGGGLGRTVDQSVGDVFWSFMAPAHQQPPAHPTLLIF
jgi:hypothetical protein